MISTAFATTGMTSWILDLGQSASVADNVIYIYIDIQHTLEDTLLQMDLSHENRPTVLPESGQHTRPILAAKNGPPGPLLVAKSGPILPKLVLAQLNLGTKIGPGRPLKVVPRTSLCCYEWPCFPILSPEKAE